jgi:hypothetical protein
MVHIKYQEQQMPQLSRRAVCTLLLACLASPAWSANSATNWEVVRQGQGREDISTWVRSVDGMAVKAFRGVTEVHYNTLAVLALLADIPGLANWIYQCKSSSQPSGYSPDHTYARFRGIWPASDRDVLFRTTVSQQADNSVLVDTQQVDGYPKDDDFVRMPLLHNAFRLVPLPGNWTRVEFETQVDLGGLVPTWLANMVSTKAPLVTLQGMQQQLGKPKYQIKSVDELPVYYLKGKVLTFPESHLRPDATDK